MKWQPRKKRFIDCNRKLTYYPDKKEGYSYDHWCFFREINGKMVFNTGFYSNTTNKHQYTLRSFLRSEGIKVDAFVDIGNRELTEHNIKEYGKLKYFTEIVSTLLDINTKGSRKATNENRRARLEALREEMNTMASIGAKPLRIARIVRELRSQKNRRKCHDRDGIPLKKGDYIERGYRGEVEAVQIVKTDSKGNIYINNRYGELCKKYSHYETFAKGVYNSPLYQAMEE